MIRRSVLDHAPTRSRVNVTPMIDVVMCLIVFYLMVGQLALNRAAGVRIPQTADGVPAPDSTADPIVIGILDNGRLVLNGEPIRQARLTGELQGRVARSPETRVEIRADREVSFGLVRPALNAARDAGVREVDMVTERGG
ncbi:MAG: biopolymer transporter ExbD [Planctomycetota bacterium]